MSSDTPKHGYVVSDGTDAGVPQVTLDAPVTFGTPGDIPPPPTNPGGGTVVFNSMGDSLDDAWNPHDGGADAQSFSTGAGVTSVTDVQMMLNYFGGSSDGGHVSVELFSDSSTRPGTLLATLGTIQDSSLPTSFGTVDLTVAGAPTLTADTRYWIELTASTDNVNWGATDSTAGTGVSTEFMDASGSVDQDGQGFVSETFLMSVTTEAACFAAGTRIRTAQGDVPVEALRTGDLVVTPRDGGMPPVRWIGRRRLRPGQHPRPWDVNPIRIRAEALGPGMPARDLLLSPDHALFLDGVLARARDLLNGATIVQETVTEITYYHVELDRHEALLAEGAPAESFLDTGNRAAFDNGGAATMAHPEFARTIWQEAAFAPLVWHGPRLAAIRARLAARAWQLGWAQSEQPALHALAGDEVIHPARENGALAFRLPPGLDTVRLRSRSTVPAYVLPDNIDTRHVGVAIASLALDGRIVPLDSDALGAGWLAAEDGLRWTDGAAEVRVDGARRLEVRVHGLALPYWLSPADADAAVLAACAA